MKRLTGLFIISAFLVPGCATVNTYSDADRSVDFTRYRTFAWLPNRDLHYKDVRFDNQIVESNVKNNVNKEMQDRGYSIELDSPDLILEYNIMIETATDQVETPIYRYPYNYNWNIDPYYDGYYRYRFGYTIPPPYVIAYKTETVRYTEGTLMISVIDRKKNRLVWRGWSEGTITSPEGYKERLASDIHKIFMKYPVAPNTVNSASRP